MRLSSKYSHLPTAGFLVLLYNISTKQFYKIIYYNRNSFEPVHENLVKRQKIKYIYNKTTYLFKIILNNSNNIYIRLRSWNKSEF